MSLVIISSSVRSLARAVGSYLEFTTVPEEIRQRIAPNDQDHQRVAEGLLYRRNVQAVPSDALTEAGLNRLAQETNATFFHASGNCVLLSRSLLRNLVEENNALAVQNSFPIYQGLSSSSSDSIVFGQKLKSIGHAMMSLDELEAAILANYHANGERFYIVSSQGYQVPVLGQCGHDFNAVVLFNAETDQPYVQFVDAWKTSNHTPTKEKLSQSYKGAIFFLSTSPR